MKKLATGNNKVTKRSLKNYMEQTKQIEKSELKRQKAAGKCQYCA